ncbi:DUF3592 domain-containing protein [Luteimonas sp. SJ-92]|uniref:DUF3592 domain-containing protein n=1 Tax=Luteimonas salinisoli TaxID=2752307 RepID=A0A853JD73_9GAMM|nr:DUF3592 domain-containing protein [Luteimonas salinisoli]NZA27241.1 DUF3592 domain-containing protein [Luteimonas salinisoli]
MKILVVIKYLFAAIGVGMLLGALLLFSGTRSFLAEAVRAEGVVVDLERSRSSESTTYRPVVLFTAQDGQEATFVSSSGSNPPSHRRGERVQVLYPPGRPEEARIDGFFPLWGAVVILGGIGSAFFLIGGGMVLFGALKGRDARYLRANGMRIEAEITGVERNEGLSVNGRSPYCIVGQWQNPTTSEVHVFRSDNIWFDPTDYLRTERMPVLIDRNKPGRYLVDLSFLPKLAN